jgi:hypothetical protein
MFGIIFGKFLAQGTTKKPQFCTGSRAPKTQSRAQCLDKREQCRKKSTKKHHLWHKRAPKA